MYTRSFLWRLPGARDAQNLTVVLSRCAVQGSDPVYDGNVYDNQISQLISLLNSVYNPVGFQFVLKATDRTQNADWFANMVANSAQEAAAQQALHVGNLQTVRSCQAWQPAC